MGTLDEIVLAIDPALRKIEEILLWKNKLKTVLVFSFIHLVFWLFIIYNVRIYCIIASVFLLFHLLDAYRTKKRRELNKLKQQSAHRVIKSVNEHSLPTSIPSSSSLASTTTSTSFLLSCLNNSTRLKSVCNWLKSISLDYSSCANAVESTCDENALHISPLGRYIIFVHSRLVQFLNGLSNLKQKNKIQYFLVLLLFWSMLAVIGIKIKGLYLSYATFWLVFFLPPILHYDFPKKALGKCLPLLEQLDASMKYERRSILDKNELLVDVRLPKMGIDDDEQEEEYLKPFKFDEAVGRELLEKLDDGDDDDDTTEDYVASPDAMHIDEDEEIQEEFEYEVHQPRHRTVNVDEEASRNATSYEIRGVVKKKVTSKKATKPSAPPQEFADDGDDDEVDESMLPNEALPSYMDVTDTTEQSFNFNYSAVKGDRVMKIRAAKNRPSLLDYYGEAMSAAKATTSPSRRQDNDIDETFDFLDEELKKY